MSRPVSGVERLWLAAARIAAPFANQIVVEGEGTLPSDEALALAIAAASTAMPGARYRLTGFGRGLRWAPGAPPVPVLRVEPRWDARSDAGAPWLREPLDPRRGPAVAVVAVPGDTPRLVFRSLHALMDGRGTELFARGVFAALRGENVVPADGDGTTDLDVAGPGAVEPVVAASCPSALPGTGKALAVTWRRRTVAGSGRRIVARLALALAARTDSPAACRIDVPVDLRAFAPDHASTGNLTGIVRLPVAAGLAPWAEPAGVDALSAELRHRIGRGDAQAFVRRAAELGSTPIALMTSVGRTRAQQRLQSGRYETTATISNLGRVELAGLSGGPFQARSAFWIPPGNPGLPLFVTVSGGPAGLELAASAPVDLAADGRLDSLLDVLEAAC